MKNRSPFFKLTMLSLATITAASPALAMNGEESNPPSNDTPEAAAHNVKIRMANETANALYDQFFPYYIEACATSSYHPLNGEDGGSFGHGIMLIHGACRDTSNPAGPQQIRFCAENPNSTVGISTDAQYHNVNWTLVDTRSAMLYGDMDADQPFSAETRLKMIDDSLKMGVYHNVVAKPWNQKEAGEMGLSLNQWMAQFGFGTDYALTMARGVSCTRVPLVGLKKGKENGPLLAVIKYLNELNRKAWNEANSGKELGYQYEYMVNNCTHPTANALAQLGLVHERNTSLPGPDGLMQQIMRRQDFAVPYSVMYETYKESTVRTRVEPIIRNLLEKPKALRAFKEWGWIGSQPGVIIEDLPPHTYRNTYFHTELSRAFYEFVNEVKRVMNDKVAGFMPLGWRPFSEDDRLMREYIGEMKKPATVNIAANLRKWKALYEELLRDDQLNNGREIETELKNHLQGRLTQIDEMLKRMSSL